MITERYFMPIRRPFTRITISYSLCAALEHIEKYGPIDSFSNKHLLAVKHSLSKNIYTVKTDDGYMLSKFGRDTLNYAKDFVSLGGVN